MRFIYFVVLVMAVLAFGCERSDGKYSSTGLEVSGDPDDPVVGFAADDAAMNAAIRQAKATVNDFLQALQRPDAADLYFAIKKPFPTSGGDEEHIWIADVVYDGERFTGTLSNIPADVPGLEHGQRVVVALNEISDWMVVDNGRLIGGYTIRVFRDRLSDQERSDFDRESGLLFD